MSTTLVFRSPSPEPVYDSNGKRLNTREVRKRQELEQLRHEKIQALLRINPNYKPPADYRFVSSSTLESSITACAVRSCILSLKRAFVFLMVLLLLVRSTAPASEEHCSSY